MAQEVIHSRQIEVHFAGEFGPELFNFEIDHDIASQAQMIKKQIEKIVLAADFQMVLVSDECKSLAEFQNQVAQMVDQTSF